MNRHSYDGPAAEDVDPLERKRLRVTRLQGKQLLWMAVHRTRPVAWKALYAWLKSAQSGPPGTQSPRTSNAERRPPGTLGPYVIVPIGEGRLQRGLPIAPVRSACEASTTPQRNVVLELTELTVVPNQGNPRVRPFVGVVSVGEVQENYGPTLRTWAETWRLPEDVTESPKGLSKRWWFPCAVAQIVFWGENPDPDMSCVRLDLTAPNPIVGTVDMSELWLPPPEPVLLSIELGPERARRGAPMETKAQALKRIEKLCRSPLRKAIRQYLAKQEEVARETNEAHEFEIRHFDWFIRATVPLVGVDGTPAEPETARHIAASSTPKVDHKTVCNNVRLLARFLKLADPFGKSKKSTTALTSG